MNTTPHSIRTLAAVLAIAGTLLLAGCSAAEGPDATGDATAPSAAMNELLAAPIADRGAAGGAASPAATPADSAVSLGFTGDICFADDYFPMEHLAELGSSNIADGIDERFIELMARMDLMWINNEFCYSDRGEPLEDKMWTFRSSPAHVSYLHDLGVDVVGLANNHVYDYGEEAFLDTLDTLAGAGIPYGGAGRNLEEAARPVYLQAGDITIGYVAASRAEKYRLTPGATQDSPGILLCYDMDDFLASVREAAAHADYVVALPHWGTEHETELEDAQVEGARQLIDAGADAVIGAHPHILQGLEFYQGKPILYSLGNFWFDDYDIDTLVAELRLSRRGDDEIATQVVLHPGTQSDVFTAWADTPEWRRQIFDDLQDISPAPIVIADDGTVTQG